MGSFYSMLHLTIRMLVKWSIRGFHQTHYFNLVSLYTMRETSDVDKFTFLSLTGGLTSMGSFPDSRNVRYPTPGTINPEVRLWLLDLHNLTDVKKYQLKEPASLEGQ